MKIKQLLALPLLVFILLVVSCAGNIIKNQKLKETEVIDTDDSVSIQIVNKAPIFPGCEGNRQDEMKNCMNQKMIAFVKDNFNKDVSKKLGLEGGVTIYAMFTIDKVGNITDVRVRAPHEELEKETKRVLDLLPQFTPGEQGEDKIRVTYIIPIRYEVEEAKEGKL